MSRKKQRSPFDQGSEFDRGRIVAYLDCGLSFRKISSRVGRNQSPVMRICDQVMNSQIIPVALLLFLYVAESFAQSQDEDSRNEEFLTIVNCVSESGDQDLCDELLNCIDLEAKPVCVLNSLSFFN
ncbi:hypothetical protein TNCV_786801 [Trichonephila clavipes]|nr:hypothetical protein TNCV_786801 [Trichonephila clavipes]